MYKAANGAGRKDNWKVFRFVVGWLACWVAHFSILESRTGVYFVFS